MRAHVRLSLLLLTIASPMVAQAPRAATYITNEEVQAVNRQPGIDRTIRVVDIGSENFAVGIIHPAGVPHGWTDITDHVDYLSFRPSDHVLQAGYVHPSIKK